MRRGWFNQSYRHALAAKGVKTRLYARSNHDWFLDAYKIRMDAMAKRSKSDILDDRVRLEEDVMTMKLGKTDEENDSEYLRRKRVLDEEEKSLRMMAKVGVKDLMEPMAHEHERSDSITAPEREAIIQDQKEKVKALMMEQGSTEDDYLRAMDSSYFRDLIKRFREDKVPANYFRQQFEPRGGWGRLSKPFSQSDEDPRKKTTASALTAEHMETNAMMGGDRAESTSGMFGGLLAGDTESLGAFSWGAERQQQQQQRIAMFAKQQHQQQETLGDTVMSGQKLEPAGSLFGGMLSGDAQPMGALSWGEDPNKKEQNSGGN